MAENDNTYKGSNYENNNGAYGFAFQVRDWSKILARKYRPINRYFSILYIVLDVLSLFTTVLGILYHSFDLTFFYYDFLGTGYYGFFGSIISSLFILLEIYILNLVLRDAPYAQHKFALVVLFLYKTFIHVGERADIVFLIFWALAIVSKYLAVKENEAKGLFAQLAFLEQEANVFFSRFRAK